MTLACDCDGTLLDSERVFKEVSFAVLADLGLAMPEADYDRQIGLPDAALWASWSRLGMSQAVIDEARRRISAKLGTTEIPLKSGFPDLLLHARDLGHRLVLATSASRRHVDRRVPAAVLALFDRVITAESVTRRKPDPEIYLLARAAFPDQRTVVVEDSPPGVAAAVAAGCPCHLIPDLIACDESVRRCCAGIHASASDLIGRLPGP